MLCTLVYCRVIDRNKTSLPCVIKLCHSLPLHYFKDHFLRIQGRFLFWGAGQVPIKTNLVAIKTS